MKRLDPQYLVSKARVAVIGDIILDEYLSGEVRRVSPEAPVVVVRRKEGHCVPGGAANVAANIAAFGAEAILVGVIGEDAVRHDLLQLLAQHGKIDLAGLVTDRTRCTTRKKRILAHGQQIVRVDYEDTHDLPDETQAKIIAEASRAILASDVVVISDYGKGVLSDRVLAALFEVARANGKRTIVDPKRTDLIAYRGAALITPNRAELAAATGLKTDTDADVERAARAAHRASGADILLTRSEKGMSYLPRRGKSVHLPTVAREVFDVSGAGDTVIAVLSTMLAAGYGIHNAMRVANHAAGIVVGKIGTATLTRGEVLTCLAMDTGTRRTEGLVSWEEAFDLRNRWREEGYTVGIANGCFDLLHPGHISLIRQAAAACDKLIMALNTDASVRRLKGPTRPVQTEAARAEVVGAIKGVDCVVLFDQDTPLQLIEYIQPDAIVKGADYRIDQVVGADIVQQRGGRVILVELTPNQSTTRLLEKAS